MKLKTYVNNNKKHYKVLKIQFFSKNSISYNDFKFCKINILNKFIVI